MTSISTLGQALDQMERLKNLQAQMSDLETQITSGHKTNTFAGLGTMAVTSARSRANFDMFDTYVNNIKAADTRIGIMSNAMGEIKSQAQNIVGQLTVQPTQGNLNINTLSTLSGNVSDFITTLVNQKDGNRYLFGGANTLNSPMTDDGSTDTYMQSMLTKWVNGTINTDTLIQSYRDSTKLTDTTLGYSPQLASGNVKAVTVRVDQQTELDYTVPANTSSIRDVIVVSKMLKNLGKVVDQVSSTNNDPPGTITAPGATAQQQQDNFYQLYNDLANMLNQGLSKLDQDSTNLAQTQVQMDQISANHTTEKNTLKATIDSVENVDINEAAVKINALQTQMEASYRITASMGALSLVNFLQQ